MLENCNEQSLQPCSVDLRIGKLYKVVAKGIIDFEKNLPRIQEVKLPYVLKPDEYVLASTFEKIDQKHTKYGVIALPRSRAYRVGLGIQCGLLHPYYKGEMVFGIKNISRYSIKLTKGLSIIQLCFFEIKSDTVPLSHQYQNGRVI